MRATATIQIATTGPAHPRTPFRLITVKGKLVKPDLDLDRTAALLAEDEESSYRVTAVVGVLCPGAPGSGAF